MAVKVNKELKSRAGSLDGKPPWMKHKTFEALKTKYDGCWVKYDEATYKEFLEWYPNKKDEIDRFF